MKVQLTTQLSGSRDGVEWPAAGSVVDLPADEAGALIAAGIAVAPGKAPVESAVLTTEVETAVVDTKPKRRKA